MEKTFNDFWRVNKDFYETNGISKDFACLIYMTALANVSETLQNLININADILAKQISV